MSNKLPPVLTACLSTGALVAGMVAYLMLPPAAHQVIATAFMGPQRTQAAAAQHPEVRRISADEAKNLSNALYVDVRTQGEYEAGHIKGALWAPFEQIMTRAAALPKGQPLVLYCT